MGNAGRLGRAGELSEADVKRYHLEEARRLFADTSAAAASRKLFEDAGSAAAASVNSRLNEDRDRHRGSDVPVDPAATQVSRRLTASHRLPNSSSTRKESCDISARQKASVTNDQINARSNRSDSAADENLKTKENIARSRRAGLDTTAQDDPTPDSAIPDSARSDGLNSTFSNAEDTYFPSNPIGLMRKPINVPALGLDNSKLQPAAWLSGQPTQGDVYK